MAYAPISLLSFCSSFRVETRPNVFSCCHLGMGIVGLSSTRADEAGDGVPPQAGELAQAKSSGAFPSPMLAEGVHALRPDRFDLGQQL